MKKRLTLAFAAAATALALAAGTSISKLHADDEHHFKFQPDSLVQSRRVCVGTASTVTIGETLPRGCFAESRSRRRITVTMIISASL